MTQPSPTDQDALVTEVAAMWLDGLEGQERTRGEVFVRELVVDWEREAGASTQPGPVLQILRDDNRQLAVATPAARRVEVLERSVLQRLVDGLAGRTYALGVAVIDGTIGDSPARDRGRALLAEAEALGARTKGLPRTPETESIHRTLSNAVMEALYVVERKAMSARLDRYQRGRSAPP